MITSRFWEQNRAFNRDWTSRGGSRSLVTVGSEAVATQSHDVIYFSYLNTNKHEFLGVNGSLGHGISLMAGHETLPVFAYAEETLRPHIRIQTFPQLELLCKFESPNVTKYVDLRFSKYDHLIALTALPNYTIRVFNFRLNSVLIELDTNFVCGMGSLVCCNSFYPTIAIYSKLYKKLQVYDLCSTAGTYTLPKISSIQLAGEEDQSEMYNMCFTPDNSLYVVNDYGNVSKVEIGLFYLKSQWLMKQEGLLTKPRAYMIRSGNDGLYIANYENVYFIKEKGKTWELEFQILNISGGVRKLIQDCNKNVYFTTSDSNIFLIDINHPGILQPITTDRFKVVGATPLNGIYFDAIVVWKSPNFLRLIELNRMADISEITANDISCLNSHNSEPYIVIGTTTGKIGIINFERPKFPIFNGNLNLKTGNIHYVKAFKNVILVVDVFQNIFVVTARHQQQSYFLTATISSNLFSKTFINFFVIKENQIMVFYSNEKEDYWPSADEMVTFEWSLETESQISRNYALPSNYIDFVVRLNVEDGIFKFFGARQKSVIVDLFIMDKAWTLHHSKSIQTAHKNYLLYLAGARNLVTTSVMETYVTFQEHKIVIKEFEASVLIDMNFKPLVPILVQELFRKFFLTLHEDNTLRVVKLPEVNREIKPNRFLTIPDDQREILPNQFEIRMLNIEKEIEKPEPTPADLEKRAQLKEKVNELAVLLSELIDYDIEVTGKTKGEFTKFCLNEVWFDKLKKEANLLCINERNSIMAAIKDQERIRDWIYNLITKHTKLLMSKVRTIFSNNHCDNYSLKKSLGNVAAIFDLYLFQDMEEPENELKENNEGNINNQLKLYSVKGPSVYDHIMRKEFEMQPTNEISFFEMHNSCTKFAHSANDALKVEFNRYFVETVEYKKKLIGDILSANGVLNNTYNNMNIMRKLLYMESFTPPDLLIPEWSKDEDLDRILTVDDSEIKATNRRETHVEVERKKSGRWLLWPVEFWERSLMKMMDGVLEKLWEEEIKKDIPIPEFVIKKDPHDYTLAEQLKYQEYLDQVEKLEQDRQKYLRILARNETKEKLLKKSLIQKVNEKISELAILKLKYDFALKQCRMRLINTKVFHFKRIQYILSMTMIRKDLARILKYIQKYTKFCSNFDQSVADIKNQLEALRSRERNTDRYFRSSFIHNNPEQLVNEMRKQYKRQPKISKNMLSVMNCGLLYKLIGRKDIQKFPIPPQVAEYMRSLNDLDDCIRYMPIEMELKQWEQFVKLRRLKLENYFRITELTLNLENMEKNLNKHQKNIHLLKNVYNFAQESMEKTKNDYVETLENRSLVITLTVGQVEVKFAPRAFQFHKFILMSFNDITDINARIQEFGDEKMRAMERVASFRRRVTVKEWEHAVTRANISYLKYMLDVIEKSKVSREFLLVLRSMNRFKEGKADKIYSKPIENVVEEKILSAQTILNRYLERIDLIRERISRMKKKNIVENKRIENIRVDLALDRVKKDDLAEEKRTREQKERELKIRAHRKLMEKIRSDYVRIMELRTIIKLEILRKYELISACDSGPRETEDICMT